MACRRTRRPVAVCRIAASRTGGRGRRRVGSPAGWAASSGRTPYRPPRGTRSPRGFRSSAAAQSNSIFALYNPYDAIKTRKIVQTRHNGGYEIINRSEQVLNPINNIVEFSTMEEEIPIAEEVNLL